VEEGDLAKVAYAKIILAIYELRNEIDSSANKIQYPDHIFINESGYSFGFTSDLEPPSIP
jgi:hypothetical protein